MINEWILSVVGIVVLSAAIILILPENRLSAYVKSIFSIISLIVILQPLFTFKNADFSFKDMFNDKEISLNIDYLYYINGEKILALEHSVIKIVENNQINGANVKIIAEYDDNTDIILKKVLINLKNAVINSDKAHIDIIVDITAEICKYLNVNEEVIEFHE